MLNKENVKKWTDALRSGKYVQTQGVLRKPGTNEMCCLGVLCDLYVKENSNSKWGNEVRVKPFNGGEVQGQVFVESGDKFISMPPAEVIDWSGFTLSKDSKFWGELAKANDAGETFEQIAKRIEERFALIPTS